MRQLTREGRCGRLAKIDGSCTEQQDRDPLSGSSYPGGAHFYTAVQNRQIEIQFDGLVSLHPNHCGYWRAFGVIQVKHRDLVRNCF